MSILAIILILVFWKEIVSFFIGAFTLVFSIIGGILTAIFGK